MPNGTTTMTMRRPGIPVLLLLATGITLLLTKHWIHGLGFLPYAFLLACPLMHLFHGHGHGRGRAHDGHDGPQHGSDERVDGAR